MVRLAKKGDVIVKLDTGSGKTFIASMLIQHMLPQTRNSLNNGGKRIVFLVKTGEVKFVSFLTATQFSKLLKFLQCSLMNK